MKQNSIFSYVNRNNNNWEGVDQWRTQNISEGRSSFVTIVWHHKSTLGEMSKARPF